MNVREEDKQKNNCPSRGLGLAAAAIGVGVGAALYYFFSKRPENPDGEGSTTSGWSCEQPHALSELDCTEDSYTTISEHSTTDTSIHTDESTEDSTMETSSNWSESESDESEAGYAALPTFSVDNATSDSDMDWDMTRSSLGVPEDGVRSPSSPLIQLFSNWGALISPRPRHMHSRERSWSLEECSICFDIMLKDQEVTTLPCTHNFHSACITPWLQEQQTCPNCRKVAE